MRNTKIHLLLYVIILLTYSCKKPTENINVIFNTSSLFKAPLMVSFQNVSDLPEFPVAISGKDSAMVQMSSGSTNFRVINGALALALRSKAQPSVSNPIRFTINVNIDGYLPIRQDITVSGNASVVFPILMTKKIIPVEGSSVLDIDIALDGGNTTKDEHLSTTTTSSLSQKVEIVIDPKTGVTDDENKLINAKAFRARFHFFGTSAKSLDYIFPGYKNVLNAKDVNGKQIAGGIRFTSAGLLRISGTAGSDTVSYFSKAIRITQELPAGLINPLTGDLLKAGESIPVWLLDEASGLFKESGQSAPVSAKNGKLVASYTVQQSGTWNLAWGQNPNSPTVVRKLDINLVPAVQPLTGTYDIWLQNAAGVNVVGLHLYQAERDFFQVGTLVNGSIVYQTTTGKYGLQLPLVPNASSGKVVVYQSNGAIIAESTIFNPLSTSSVQIDIDNRPPPPIEYLNINTVFWARCTNRNITAPLNAWVTISNLTNNTSNYVFVRNGSFDTQTETIRLIVGHEYKISSSYGGVSYNSEPFKAIKSNYDFSSASSSFNGNTTYDAATNTLTINGTISQECN